MRANDDDQAFNLLRPYFVWKLNNDGRFYEFLNAYTRCTLLHVTFLIISSNWRETYNLRQNALLKTVVFKSRNNQSKFYQ